MKKKCLGIITARGGSKGVPGKNMKLLNGKPLLQYTLEFCKACEQVDKYVISTDSEEMASFAVAYGAEAPFLRPPELSGDLAKQEDAILHTMDYYGEDQYDCIAILTPTNPFRRPATFSRAYQELTESQDIQAVMSVVQCEHAPLFANILRRDRMMVDWVEEKYKWANRQELPIYYRLAGSIVISEWEAFRNNRTVIHDAAKAFPVDSVEAQDIDTLLDFMLCELLMDNQVNSERDLRI